MSTLEERIRSRSLELGFDAAGIAPSEPGRHLAFFLDWVAAGYHAEQSYLARPDRLARRQDLNLILPGVRSLLVVGLRYWTGHPPPQVADCSRGNISCYAVGTDYHRLMLPRLEELHAFVRGESSRPVRGRVYVDTGPLLERDHALRAGLGFLGKNCHLIEPRHGSWLFLGILMMDLELNPDRPGWLPSCGTCMRCQQACPTGALVRPFILDSGRCISYWTTALKGSIPREHRSLLGNHVFGCDVCQTVCPWNRFARPSPRSSGRVDATPLLSDLIGLNTAEFQRRYGHTPIGHLGRDRFLRNVAVAMGNWGAPEASPALEGALADPSPMVRGHAAWALGEIGSRRARRVLASARARETDTNALDEITRALLAR